MSSGVKAKKAKPRSQRETSSELTVDEALAAAEQKYESGDLEGSAVLYEHVARKQPDNAAVLDAFGEVLLELGRVDDAKRVLAHSVSVAPDSSPAKYMMLAQISEGEDAATNFKAGINLLKAQLEVITTSESMDPVHLKTARMLRRELSDAYCSLAELYMTDLCDEDKAESECAAYASLALQSDDQNPEAYNVAANLRLCQRQGEEAQELLQRCGEMLQRCYAAVDAQPREDNEADGDDVEDDEDDDGDMDDGAGAGAGAGSSSGAGAGADSSSSAAANGASLPAEVPPWEGRFHFAKTCSEAELYGLAASTLERLLQEDDSNLEAWFLLGEALLLNNRPSAAADVLEEALALVNAAITMAGGKAGKKSAGSSSSSSSSAALAEALASHAEAVAELAAQPMSELKGAQAQIQALMTIAQQKVEAGEGEDAEEGDEDDCEDDDDGEDDDEEGMDA